MTHGRGDAPEAPGGSRGVTGEPPVDAVGGREKDWDSCGVDRVTPSLPRGAFEEERAGITCGLPHAAAVESMGSIAVTWSSDTER